jgi:SUN family beta-glucosidase
MTIPYVVPAGGAVNLPVIPMDKYWHTRSGAPTSAQFYINNKGVPVEQACIWGNGDPRIRAGNAAPMNLGGGAEVNDGYWSMFSNKPTQPNPLLDFKIKMSGSGITPSIGCEYDGPVGVVKFNGQDISTLNMGGASGCTIRAERGGELEYLLY